MEGVCRGITAIFWLVDHLKLRYNFAKMWVHAAVSLDHYANKVAMAAEVP